MFHHANLDVAFLKQGCVLWAGVEPPFVILDTMHIELAMHKRRNLPIQQGDLKLGSLRARYKLPRYTEHNALIDACATAELMLAIAAGKDSNGSLNLQPHVIYE